MRSGKDNEMKFILAIFKSPESEYNSRNLAKILEISPMGSLKIARKLEEKEIIKSKQVGKSKIYKINFENKYSGHYVMFLLKREAEEAKSYVKRWIRELSKIKSAEALILFGSVLKKDKGARDIDVLVIVNKKNFDAVKKEVDEINMLNEKKVHPVYQTRKDLEKHIREENKIVLNAIKGVVVFGEETLIPLLKK
jgi:predicted nucleotidyltransferase